MKCGLCLIYTSLLTISLLSSCALFVLVVSEVAGDVNAKVDLSGLHNVSQKTAPVTKRDISTNIPKEHVKEKIGDNRPVPEDQEMMFTDTLSLNSVTTDGLPDTGQPPIFISLADNAKLELKNPDELLFVNDSEQHNDTKTFTIVDGSDVVEEPKDQPADAVKENTEPRLVVKAKPMHEARQPEELFPTTTPVVPEAERTKESQIEEYVEPEKENIPKSETPQEDIPSFSEWAQKQLAEAEKKDTVLNHSSQPSHSNTNFSSKSTKLRTKNYASPACGSKIVAVNPEAGSANSILSPNRDEYMLNTCNSRIWFVVELCEAVQAQKIEIANFELFSSTPKDIAVYFSDRFPTREWASVGQFTAKDIRDVQSFDLFPHLFGKFIKVEMLSHHGSEHYCPISLFKVYGTSEFEVLEKESSQHPTHIDEDEEDEIIDVPDVPTAQTEPSKNLFGSARDAVMSIMKKAAQALVKTEVPNKNMSSEINDTSADKMYKRCCSPSHIIVCDNCSETLYNEVFELISCSSDKLTNLVRQVFLRETLKCTGICQPFGLDFKCTKALEFSDERVSYVSAFFPRKYLAALCNILAIKEKKVVLNTSFETEMNVTTNITVEETQRTMENESNLEQDIKLVPIKNNASTEEKTDDNVQPEEKQITPEQNISNTVPVELPKEEKEKLDDKNEESVPNVEVKQAPVQDDAGKPPQEQDKVLERKVEQEAKDTAKSEIKNKIEVNTEKSKEGSGSGIEEMNEQIIIDNDNFISELDQIAVDPTPAGTSQNQNQAQTTIQKESVFLRLSNRVKTLERNMSLSGQYLEELSRRYKKQVEEMQKSFEKTMSQMTEERRKSNEREQKYMEQMAGLQEQLLQMSIVLKTLMDDRDSWFGNLTFFKFLVFQILIITTAVYFFRPPKNETIVAPISRKAKKKQEKFRRRSVEGVSGHETPSAKKRRPSEEALQIARLSTEEMSKDEDGGEWQIAKKNRKRKTSIVHRNVESDSKINWGQQDPIGKLQENPIPLDEEEFFAPVSEPKQFNDDIKPETPKKELPKTNGSIFSNLKSKTMKTRRLSSPAFLRTLSRQSSRSNPSPPIRNSEPMYNGKVSKKAASESPTSSLWSESTDFSHNGQQDIESGRKKKSIKNIFKKVF